MKKLFILLCTLATTALALPAQDQKLRVAVFDPTSSGTTVDEGTKVAVREIISSTFVNTGKYTIVERSLLDRVMKEQAFSNTDVVDESQATELGRLAGANKIVLSVVTLVGGRNMLSIKIIDVQTATVDQQKTKIVSSNDLLDVVEPLTLELLGEEVTITVSSGSGISSTSNNDRESKENKKPNIMNSVTAFGITSGEEMMTNYKKAQAFCAQSSKDGFHDWRVPTLTELFSVYKDRASNGLSPATATKWYWTSTCLDKKCKTLQVLNMTNGKTGTAPQRKDVMVLCVR
jgi:hypothetical protein